MRYFCVMHSWDSVAGACPSCRLLRPRVREEVLERAIVAAVSGDVRDVDELYTPDIVSAGPATNARSREELAIEIEERRAALSRPEVAFGNIDIQDNMVRVEWRASALHVGPLVLEGSGALLEPTGLRLCVRAVTVARFRDDRICSWRSHWDNFQFAS